MLTTKPGSSAAGEKYKQKTSEKSLKFEEIGEIALFGLPGGSRGGYPGGPRKGSKLGFSRKAPEGEIGRAHV